MIAATSATVRNRTALSGVASAAIDNPLRRFLLRQAIFSAPVTPVSSVIGTRERATPSTCLILPAYRQCEAPIFGGQTRDPPAGKRLPAASQRRAPCRGPWRPQSRRGTRP